MFMSVLYFVLAVMAFRASYLTYRRISVENGVYRAFFANFISVATFLVIEGLNKAFILPILPGFTLTLVLLSSLYLFYRLKKDSKSKWE